jgi:hypothetical protein
MKNHELEISKKKRIKIKDEKEMKTSRKGEERVHNLKE